MKGKIIVIEGNDCSGKETQTQLLLQRLLREGKKVERFDFPDYQAPTGKIVGGPYLGKKEITSSYFEEGAASVDPKVASLYYAADRRYALPKIMKLLDEGYYVILDRYVDSNMAHQGCKVKDKDEREKLYKWFETLEYDLLELPKPNLTILLHMPLKKVLELKKGRLYTDDHESSISYLKISEEAYLEIAKRNNHKVIECLEKDKLRDILDIHEEIYNVVIKEV
ncbi:MAG: thymidylate kinase [Bacilli bacterium]|nr:thymidylate kinase [Bacilli bacterium]